MVVVKEVKTRKELKKWVEFPNRLYKNCPIIFTKAAQFDKSIQ